MQEDGKTCTKPSKPTVGEIKALVWKVMQDNNWVVSDKNRNYFCHNTTSSYDLHQVGVIAVLECLDRVDTDKGVWSTLAYPRIRGAILDYFRRHAAGSREYRVELLCLDEFDGAEEAVEALVDDPEIDDAIDARTAVQRCVELLDSVDCREYAIIKAHCLEGKSMREAGAEHGLSKSRTSRVYNRGLEKLRRSYHGYRPATVE